MLIAHINNEDKRQMLAGVGGFIVQCERSRWNKATNYPEVHRQSFELHTNFSEESVKWAVKWSGEGKWGKVRHKHSGVAADTGVKKWTHTGSAKKTLWCVYLQRLTHFLLAIGCEVF